jgi:hypothetical protein
MAHGLYFIQGLELIKEINTHLDSQAYHQPSQDWQWPMPHDLHCFWMPGRKLMLIFLGPVKICTLTMNEPAQIWVLILQEHDRITSQQNCNYIKRNTKISRSEKEILVQGRAPSLFHLKQSSSSDKNRLSLFMNKSLISKKCTDIFYDCVYYINIQCISFLEVFPKLPNKDKNLWCGQTTKF